MTTVKTLECGWGFMILLGACIISAANASVDRSFSILNMELIVRYQASHSQTALIGGLLTGKCRLFCKAYHCVNIFFHGKKVIYVPLIIVYF